MTQAVENGQNRGLPATLKGLRGVHRLFSSPQNWKRAGVAQHSSCGCPDWHILHPDAFPNHALTEKIVLL